MPATNETTNFILGWQCIIFATFRTCVLSWSILLTSCTPLINELLRCTIITHQLKENRLNAVSGLNSQFFINTTMTCWMTYLSRSMAESACTFYPTFYLTTQILPLVGGHVLPMFIMLVSNGSIISSHAPYAFGGILFLKLHL
jgi:hypothetical protein